MYIEGSGFGDHILYTMCREYPSNDDPEVVGGKLWLIGRAYAAAVERKAGQNFNWEPLKAAIVGSDLDRQLAACKSIKRVDRELLPLVFGTHKTLTDIFKRTTGLHKRSLASKYLHFHAPSAFFIYDSIAATELQKKTKRARRFRSEHYDYAYQDFCQRCLEYREELECLHGTQYSPRKLDSVLLKNASDRKKGLSLIHI